MTVMTGAEIDPGLRCADRFVPGQVVYHWPLPLSRWLAVLRGSRYPDRIAPKTTFSQYFFDSTCTAFSGALTMVG